MTTDDEVQTLLIRRVGELEVTLWMCVSRLEIIATGGHLPRESLVAMAAEARRVVEGKREF